ncbi:MAG: helix-turn-helix domain-containing protein [Clostridia bacterium]|nr:helix-turn-helix domain-containing protein [Clostridia bacterium]
MNIAKAISDLRISRGISQEELAAALYVSRDLVSKWETGVRRPNWQMIEKTAALFGVPASYIADKNELVYKELEDCLPHDARLSADRLTDVLNSFLYGLCEAEADVFIRRYYFFDSIADIAASFDLKENHVRSTLSRTRKKLKKFIKEVPDE